MSIRDSQALMRAQRFLLALPSHLPAPELDVDADGEVALDWVGTGGRMCTVTLRADGRLDYPDDVLAGFEIVTASIHSAFNQPRAQITQRLIGAMQHRQFNLLPRPVLGFECSIEVDDVDAAAKAVEANGGKILMPKAAIPGVGWLIKFTDTEGNLVCAVHFDVNAK